MVCNTTLFPLISYALGFPMPSYFQLVLGAVSIFNTFGKETLSMTRTIMKAVGAVAAGRNRKVHMKTVGVTIYCDEGSMGSNPALPQKEAVSK